MKSFNPNVNTISVEFNCPKCGSNIQEIIEDIPVANNLADNVVDSENSEENDITCPKCDAEFTAIVYVNMNEGNVEIRDEDYNEVVKITVK